MLWCVESDCLGAEIRAIQLYFLNFCYFKLLFCAVYLCWNSKVEFVSWGECGIGDIVLCSYLLCGIHLLRSLPTAYLMLSSHIWVGNAGYRMSFFNRKKSIIVLKAPKMCCCWVALKGFSTSWGLKHLIIELANCNTRWVKLDWMVIISVHFWPVKLAF